MSFESWPAVESGLLSQRREKSLDQKTQLIRPHDASIVRQTDQMRRLRLSVCASKEERSQENQDKPFAVEKHKKV